MGVPVLAQFSVCGEARELPEQSVHPGVGLIFRAGATKPFIEEILGGVAMDAVSFLTDVTKIEPPENADPDLVRGALMTLRTEILQRSEEIDDDLVRNFSALTLETNLTGGDKDEFDPNLLRPGSWIREDTLMTMVRGEPADPDLVRMGHVHFDTERTMTLGEVGDDELVRMGPVLGS